MQFTCIFQNGSFFSAYFAGRFSDFVDINGHPNAVPWKGKTVEFSQSVGYSQLRCQQAGQLAGIAGTAVPSAKILTQAVTYYSDLRGKMITIVTGLKGK
jgi:hypothetical protein